MSHVNHDLHHQFLSDTDILHDLKVGDPEFRALADTYHQLARELHRIETGLEPASDDRLEDLKKQRLAMLDDIAGRIASKRA